MAKHIAILCNELAGAGRAIKMAKNISSELNIRDISHHIFIKEWPDKFINFTEVFIVGGDGTMNYFINKYSAIKIPLVLFNGGTGNDFHWTLYNNISFEEQLTIALTGVSKQVDIGRCNDRYFINGVGIGFEAAISKALTGKKKLPGKTSFYISVLKNIFSYRSKFYSIKTPNGDLAGKHLLIDIYNGKRAGGGFYIAPKANPQDGLLDFICSKTLNALRRIRYLPVIEKGKHLNLPFIKYFKTTKVLIASNDIIQFHLDGEYAEAAQLDIEIIASQLNFRY